MSLWEAIKDMEIWEDIDETATGAVESADDLYIQLKDLLDAE